MDLQEGASKEDRKQKTKTRSGKNTPCARKRGRKDHPAIGLHRKGPLEAVYSYLGGASK